MKKYFLLSAFVILSAFLFSQPSTFLITPTSGEVNGLHINNSAQDDAGGVGVFLNDSWGGHGGIVVTDENNYQGLDKNSMNIYSQWAPLVFSTSPQNSLTEALRITTNGRLGIGNNLPLYPIHVKTLNSNEWQAGFENGNSAAYFAHEGGFGMYVNTGGTNSSSRYAMTIRNADQMHFFVRDDGKVGVGTNEPDEVLTVKGAVHADEVRVDLLGALAPDFVFTPEYELKTLDEVHQYVEENGHLSEMPSAKEMEENGIELKQMNLKLLQKVEELTLYLIEQKGRIDELESEMADFKKN